MRAVACLFAFAVTACGARSALDVGATEAGPRDAGSDAGPRDAAVLPPPDVPFLSITVGRDHACALDEAGAVRCWGDNRNGELAAAVRTSPTPVTVDLPPVMAIDAGHDRTCAVTVDGEVWCWGQAATSEPGRPPEISFASRITFTEVVTGSAGACALDTAGSVRCIGTLSTIYPSGAESTRISGGASAIAAGSAHACAVVGPGVRCFGDNPRGELGVEPYIRGVGESGPVVTVPIVDRAVAVAAGFDHSCAAAPGRGLFCWGSNAEGQLGLPDVGATGVPPTLLPGFEDVDGIEAGWDVTCAIRRGELFCWGDGSHGQLGTGTHPFPQPPTRVDLPGPVRSVSPGIGFTCAIDGTGRPWCWGRNHRGQLGDGTMEDRDLPVPIAL